MCGTALLLRLALYLPAAPYVVDAAVTEVDVPTAAAVLGADVPAFLAGGGVAG